MSLGELEAAKKLLADDPELIAKKFDQGASLLHLAARGGHEDVAEFLLSRGAEVKAPDKKGQTPLHDATNRQVAELFIAKGGDVNARNETDWTPLHDAALYDRREVAALLIAKGADVNAKNNHGDTPLHYGSHLATSGMAELLLGNGADPNATNFLNDTPLLEAVGRGGGKEVIETLIDRGADLKSVGGSSWEKHTALHQEEIAALLRQHGAKE